jgi:glucose-1-phosphate adenylyltransferase
LAQTRLRLKDRKLQSVITLILGGGKGTRLEPLTSERSKAAVPFGGMYRLIDIPISNCINSNFRSIFVLTQYNSFSLHNHITGTFTFDSFNQGFVKILAAEQTPKITHFHQGTADAVRKAWDHFRVLNPDHFLILSGDQLYRMDFQAFFDHHLANNADITIAAKPVKARETKGLGILDLKENGLIKQFVEKPKTQAEAKKHPMPQGLHPHPEDWEKGDKYLGSMGIYLFKGEVLRKLLDNNKADFGKEIIPEAINSGYKTLSYVFTGFWQDLGTIANFYEANLGLAHMKPTYNLYDSQMPIYTRYRSLPPSKLNFCTISQSLTADGCIITNSSIMNSVIGLRSIIDSGANLEGVVMMGADWFENEGQKRRNYEEGVPHIGIGKGTLIRKAIIDKNARIGDGCRIGVDEIHREDGDHGQYRIRDGIIVIIKGAVIPPGTVI